MGFSSRFFVALLALCVVRGVHAADCSAEEYNLPCPSADSSLGWQFAKCKLLDSNCDETGCQKYEACFQVPGNDAQYFYDVSEGCHLESDICYGNELSCNSFGNEVPNVSAVSCQVQDGSAIWNGNEWNVSNCTCVSPVVSGVNGDLNCAEFGTSLNLVSNQSVTSVNDKVQYEIVRLYCNKCLPGYIPRVVPSMTNAGIGTRPDDNRDWGCMACDQVHAPNYAPGCVINFSWDSAVVGRCTQICPSGFETTANGATNINDCQYDGRTTYTDRTGTFYINSLEECH